MLGIILRFVLGVGLGLSLLPLLCWALVLMWRRVDAWWPEDPWWCLGGLVLGLFMLGLRPNWFLHTFLHECAHAVACLCLGVRVEGFSATAKSGGSVTFAAVDPVRSTLIAIAPYTLPLVVVPLFIVQHAAHDAAWRGPVSFLAAWALVAHLHGLFHNVRLNFFGSDSDLAVTGRLLGLVLIACGLVALAILAVEVLWNSARIIPGWWI